MQRKRSTPVPCAIARGLEHVGDWWSMLILRDALRGVTRFDAFQKSLGIAPNMLTRRLATLVDAGLLTRQRYSDHPPRDEYVLTDAGRDFAPVLAAMFTWSNRHFAGGTGLRYGFIDSETGAPVRPVMIDGNTGVEIDSARHRYGPLDGAAADPTDDAEPA